MPSIVLDTKNTNASNILLPSSSKGSGGGRKRKKGVGKQVLIHSIVSLEMEIGQEFIRSSEDVHHMGRDIIPVLGPEKTLGRCGTCCGVELNK